MGLYLRLGLKFKKIHRVLEFNQSQWLKQYFEFITHTKIETKKNGDKDWKVLYKLMNNAVYGKTMEHLRKIIAVRFVSNEKGYLKWTSKPSYMSPNLFENDLVVILKSKVILAPKKPAYVWMCKSDLSKVLIYGFCYDYIKNK